MITHLARASTRKVLFALLPALAVGAVDALTAPVAQQMWRGDGIGRHAIVALVAAVLMWVLLSGADARGAVTARSERARPGARSAAPASWRTCLLITGIAVVGWLLMWASVGPLASMNDTYSIIRNPFGAARQHPIVYDLAVSGVVQGLRLVTGSMLPGIVLFALLQIALFTLAVAWTLRVLSRMGAPRIALVVLAVVLGYLPITANYTFALVKDSLFTAFAVLLVPVLLTVVRTRGRCLHERRFLAATVLTLLGFALTRNNALVIVVLVGVLLVVLAARARRRALVCVAAVVVVALVPQQIVRWTAGPPKSVESLGVPLQMVGSTLVDDPGCIPADDARTFERIMPAQQWRDVFRPESVDPVKDSASFSEDELERSRGAFLGAVAGTLRACPGPMMAGYRDQTAQLWQVDTVPVGRTSQSFFLEPISNYPADREEIIGDLAAQGVTKQPLLGSAVGGWQERISVAALDLTPGTGTWMWALVLIGLAYWYRRRGEFVAIATPALLLWGTLMAAVPTAMPFRYAAYLPWIVAIALVVLVCTREDGGPGQSSR
ncbi:hypothetical protein DEO23_06175 [Brachybacterium endophyticum]|uniref:Glycosyltransferase RgtA/B/C/D-like domain-containing protein n=1 Tax=Brachybacterium endophyticum TaxID=2182385 RepID=A0A2U2RKZ1_9MICO|nr:DUF6020 family protein [Brachybacterium endophyticum]PWH06542.1 hypothetical protein DEO23_06175 [Brachybacterium endophyticum]